MIIKLNSWKLEKDLVFSQGYTGDAIIKIEELGEERLASIYNRKSINSILSLLRYYSDWIETEFKIKLLPDSIEKTDKNLILILKIKK